MTEKLFIDRLGRQGDGVATSAGNPIFVPFTLAGETVHTAVKAGRGMLQSVESPSPLRVAPVCRHFGTCGGCQLQHFERSAYLDWKRDLVADALAREHVDAELAPITGFGAHLRRRVIFTAIRSRNSVLLGFSERQSNRIAGIDECPVLVPAIEAKLASLRTIAAILAPGKGVMKLAVLACDNGLDVSASNGAFTPDRQRQQAIAEAGRAGLLRLSLDGETLIEFDRPVLAVGRARVTPPPDAFVQAVAGAEEAMAALVTSHCRDARKAADLYSGFGAFALRMAENTPVHAAESSGAAIHALDRAWRETGGVLKALKAERRDLDRRPLMPEELKDFDAVVFDPPRAGAEIQVRELAKSKVARIAAVSCNPVTLARDLRILVEGGYRLSSVTPFDQFVYTPHVEAVALLER